MESKQRLERSSELCWVPGPGCCDPSCSQLLTCSDHLSILSGARKKWSFWAACCTAGEAKCALTVLSFSPVGEVPGWRRSVLTLSCAMLQEKWPRWNETSSFFRESVLRNCAKSMLEPFRWTSGFPQIYSHPWVVVKISVVSEDDNRKLLFRHLLCTFFSFVRG